MQVVDIKEINGRYYDFGCGINNRANTFLQTAMELKTLGIKNYFFMLEIFNPNAAYIDPYKPNITEQEIQVLLREASKNLWFYARNIARIRTDGGILPFGLHRGLAAQIWCVLRNQDSCLTEPRQTWKTTGIIATPITWTFQFSKNLDMHFFGKGSENTIKNLATVRDNIDLLPEWMQFKRYMDIDGKAKKTRQSTQILNNSLRKNKITIHAKASSISNAESMARGASSAFMYFDEIEHTPFFDIILQNSAPAFATAHENALSAGLPTCRIFSSTPGNLDTREGRTSYPIIQSMIPWTEKIYDMTDMEIEEYKSAYKGEYHQDKNKDQRREVIDVFYIEYQYYQVRKTYQWVMDQYARIGDKTTVRREILLQRVRGSTDSPLSPEDIEYLISHMRKSSDDLLINNKWLFKLYEHGGNCMVGLEKIPFDPSIPYIIGIDPSGTGADNTAITIVNPKNLRIAAEFKNPYISTTDIVRLLITLINEYMPRAVIYPERNSMGIAIVQMLIESSIRENLYWSDKTNQVDRMAEESPEEYQMRVASDQWKKYGVYTTKKVRDMMFQILFRHVNEFIDILDTEYLVDDICKLIRTSTGKIEADKGSHDDNVMSYLIAMYLFYTGDNLELFGISNKVHPILGTIEDENEIELNPQMGMFTSTEHATFEEIAIEGMIEMEQQTKEMVRRLPFVHDDVYSNYKHQQDDDLTDIPPSFFGMM